MKKFPRRTWDRFTEFEKDWIIEGIEIVGIFCLWLGIIIGYLLKK